MPDRYGFYATAWRRLKRWSEEVVWAQIMESLRDSAYQDGKFSMDIACVDSSFIETKKGEKIPLTTVAREGTE
ncbi:MAG: TIS1421-transposase protein [Clostridia bacterium]|jgi:transposase|nr:TIS1421-transposase protein [Clostridia bacterium]